MLPATLGGRWCHTEAQLWIGYRIGVAGGLCRSLLDHPLHFRRLDAPKGKLTRHNCALLGQPYPCALTLASSGARQDVVDLAAHGFAAWARDDLSAWYPGWTELVLVAAGLDPDAADSFGFIALRTAEQADPT